VVRILKNDKITVNEYKELYQAVINFKEAKCWEWMTDVDIFGVENIDTHEMGYCCIMGNAGEMYGLSIYIGDEGLKAYMQTLHPEIPYEDLRFIQKCITVYFQDRERLNREELKLIKELGLKFRGRKQWPQFKNYTPNYFPSKLSKGEVKYMTYALEQAIDVASRCKDNKDLTQPEGEESILCRVAKKVDKIITWEDKYVRPSIKENYAEYENINEIALKRIKSNTPKKSDIWEVDFFNSPVMVSEGERSYYPMIFVAIEVESSMMLTMKIGSDFENYIDEFGDEFINLLSKSEYIPETIVVQRKSVFKMLETILKKLDIELHLVEELHIIQEFKRELREYL